MFLYDQDLDNKERFVLAQKIRPGYYRIAICRNITPEEAINRIENKEQFVIRFNQMVNMKTSKVCDEIKGTLELSEMI